MDHPIVYAIRNRETILSRTTEQDVGVNWTTADVINEVQTTVDDINRQMQIYSDHLFRQAKWEADLFALDIPTSEALDLASRAVKLSERAVTTLDDLAPVIKTAVEATTSAAGGATKFDTEMPTLVSAERKAAVEAIIKISKSYSRS